MNKSITPSPQVTARVTNDEIEAPLMDRLLQRNKDLRRQEGIDIDKMSGPTTEWEDVDAIYNTMAQAIVTMGEEVAATTKALSIVPMENRDEMTVTWRSIISDLEELTDKLLKIRARHQGLSGSVKDGNEVILSNSIIQDYAILQQQMSAVMTPALLNVTEYLAAARQKVNEALVEEEEKNDATDPTVVTDVDFKEEQTK